MEKLGTCECGGKIIKNGVGNIFCEVCYDIELDKKLSDWAKRIEKNKIINGLTNPQ
jgi:hypothetical protein